MEKLASITTPSLAALRAYLDGQAAYRRGSYEEAAQLFERALQLDGTFALAALGLANTGWCCPKAAARGLHLAWLGRDRLSPRDRMLLTAKVGPHYPDPSSQSEHLRAWEQAIVALPDRPDAWYELGDVLFHWGTALGLTDSREQAAAASRRAVELDTAFSGPLQHLIELAAIGGGGPGLEPKATGGEPGLS
jgi:tetratricopeptide (TPR) repeat protein